MAYPTNKEMSDIIDQHFAAARRQMNETFYVSIPRQQGKSMFQKYFEQAAASQSIKDTLAQDDGRRWMGIDLAKSGSDQSVVAPVWNPAAKAFPAPATPKPNTDHIWDMIVLAARASRYE